STLREWRDGQHRQPAPKRSHLRFALGCQRQIRAPRMPVRARPLGVAMTDDHNCRHTSDSRPYFVLPTLLPHVKAWLPLRVFRGLIRVVSPAIATFDRAVHVAPSRMTFKARARVTNVFIAMRATGSRNHLTRRYDRGLA